MLYRQIKVKRIQHHQTSLTTNIKGTYTASKPKRKERLQKQTQNNYEKANTKIYIYISIISLNANGLTNQPKDTDQLNGYKNKTHYILPTRDPLQSQRRIQTQSKRMDKDIPCKCNPKESQRGNPYCRQNRFQILQ